MPKIGIAYIISSRNLQISYNLTIEMEISIIALNRLGNTIETMQMVQHPAQSSPSPNTYFTYTLDILFCLACYS